MTIARFRGALLTPKEMEELTESWRPYRSLGGFRPDVLVFALIVDGTLIGVYYMWALAEDKSE